MAPSSVFIDDDMGPENCMGSYRCGWLLQSPHGGESITAYTVMPYTVEPLSVVERDGQIVVVGPVAGDFPASPINLEHMSRVAGDKIASLEIR